MATSKIEWTEASWNPIRGCTKVSPGCAHCYAERMANRLAHVDNENVGGAYAPVVTDGSWNGRLICDGSKLTEPLGWRKPRRVFVCSMSDLFHDDIPFEFIDRVFAVMNVTATQLPLPADVRKAKPWHTYQVLTKRPERMCEYMLSRDPRKFPASGTHPWFGSRNLFRGHGVDLMNASGCVQWPPSNVWLGTSAEDQQRLTQRWDQLRGCPAAVKWISAEPLLGPLDVDCCVFDREKDIRKLINGPMACNRDQADAVVEHPVKWVVVGAESGPGARDMHNAWVRSIRDQCKAAGVALFVKQLCENGRKIPFEQWPTDLQVREYPA